MALVIHDFMCSNCGVVVELMIDKSTRDDPRHCPKCHGGDKENPQPTMQRCISATSFWTKDAQRVGDQLRVTAKEHNDKIWRGEADPFENESGICSDPVWRNKTRAKNTSSDTINKHRHDHVGYSDEPSKPGSLKVGPPPDDVK